MLRRRSAAGWGWFVDRAPWDDSEFTTPGDHGEQHRLDLLTTLAHEIGHLLGYEHEEDGVMADMLTTGVRRMPAGESDWLAAVEAALGESSPRKRRPYYDLPKVATDFTGSQVARPGDPSRKVAKNWQRCQKVATLTRSRLPKTGNVASPPPHN